MTTHAPTNGNGRRPPWLAQGFDVDAGGGIVGPDGRAYLPEVLDTPRGELELDRSAPSQRRGPLVELDTAEMLRSEPPPVDWLARDVVARGTLTLFAGREKEGKSLVCQALAAAMASGGGTVAGIECIAGRALIVDAENGKAVIHRRLKALGALDAEQAGDLVFAEAWGFDLRKHRRELGELVRRVKPDLLVLDSFRSMWGGKENDADEAAQVLDPLRMLVRDLNVGTILIHHASRGGGYRGSSAIGASVENILGFVHLPDDPDRRRRRLRNEGCRYAEAADDRWLAVDADRRLDLIFVDEVEPFEAKDTAAAEQAAPVREELTPRVRAALSAEPLRLADVCRAIHRPTKDQSVRRALEGLRSTGEAIKTETGTWSLSEGCQVWAGDGCQVSSPIGVSDTVTPDTLDKHGDSAPLIEIPPDEPPDRREGSE